MNYHFLYSKYIGGTATLIVNDRTYTGLTVIGAEKPSEELFKAFQREEDRMGRVGKRPALEAESLMKEKQHQAKVQAELDAIPLEERVREEHDVMRQEILSLRTKAREAQEMLRTKEELSLAWMEIDKAQERVNQDAKRYLESTDWYVTRQNETNIAVPEEIMRARAEARERIKAGTEVYAKWQSLRETEMPSREEIKAAILAGGKELERIKEVCAAVALKYAKPKRTI